GRRRVRLEPRDRRRLHPCRVRQGLLRRAHGGVARIALCRPRVSHAGPASLGLGSPGTRRAGRLEGSRRGDGARLPPVARGPDRASAHRAGASPARLVIALSVAAVLAVFLLYTSIAGGGNPSLAPSELAGRTGTVQLAGGLAGPGSGRHHA